MCVCVCVCVCVWRGREGGNNMYMYSICVITITVFLFVSSFHCQLKELQSRQAALLALQQNAEQRLAEAEEGEEVL